jgi:hypothetical protein
VGFWALSVGWRGIPDHGEVRVVFLHR